MAMVNDFPARDVQFLQDLVRLPMLPAAVFRIFLLHPAASTLEQENAKHRRRQHRQTYQVLQELDITRGKTVDLKKDNDNIHRQLSDLDTNASARALLPQVKSILILDEDGARVSSKYHDKQEFPNLQAELDFEAKLFKKTKNVNARNEADIVLLDDVVAVFRSGVDVHLYVVGSSDENELILTAVLDALHEALVILLRGQLDRRTLLENLAMALLAVDELVDAGRILEIDPPAIANRVLMRGADAQQPQTAELGFQQALALTREEFIKRMGN